MVKVQQEHMLDFLAEVRQYSSEPDDAQRKKLSQQIFHNYIRVLAEREISLDKPVRDTLVSQLESAEPQLFSEAEAAVTEEVRRDVWPQFLKTKEFEELAGLAAQ